MTTYLHTQQDASLSIGAALTTPRAPRSLPEICYTLRRKVTTFLDEKLEDEVLRDVQTQARLSMDIIQEALGRYGWVNVLAPKHVSLSLCFLPGRRRLKDLRKELRVGCEVSQELIPDHNGNVQRKWTDM